MKRIALLTSGGDAPGMNAAIRAVVRKAHFENIKVFGVLSGFSGLIEGDIKYMDLGSVGDIIQKGGTVLHSARSDEFMLESGKEKAIKKLNAFDIDSLIVIGGDGSLQGAHALAEKGFPCIGIPATIDNDVLGTDYTIGFDTALNTIIDAVDKIRDTATSHERTFIIEVMGREIGDLALWAGVAGGAESILIPEYDLPLSEVAKRLSRGVERGKKHSIILLAEGVGCAQEYSEKIKKMTGLDTRVTVLGHIQRGGSPTAYDRLIASRFGSYAIDLILKNKKNKMVSIENNKLICKPLSTVTMRKHQYNYALHKLTDELSI